MVAPAPSSPPFPPDPRRREQAINAAVAIIVVLAILLSLIIPLLAMSLRFEPGLPPPPGGGPPTVVFEVTTDAGDALVRVVSVTEERALSNFRFSLFHGPTTIFEDAPLSDGVPQQEPLGTARFVDNDGSGTLSANDLFDLTELDPGIDHLFILKWAPTNRELNQEVFFP